MGAIAGLLLAPKPGSETRDNISTTLGDLGNKIADLSQQVTAKVKTVVDATKHATAEKLDQASDKIETA